MILGSEHIERGNALAELGRYEQAIEEYSKAIDSYHYKSLVYQQISFSYFRLKNISQASKFANKALEDDPLNDYAYYLKALIKRENNFTYDSEKLILKALEIDPDISFYYGLHSNLLLKMQLYGKAIEQAKKGLELDETEVECFITLLFAYNNTKQYEQFSEVEKTALTLYPDSRYVHHNLSIIYSYKKDFEKAEEHSSIAVKLNPDYESAVKLHEMNKNQQPFQTKKKVEIETESNLIKVFLWAIVILGVIYSKCN